MSYETRPIAQIQAGGVYVDRILRGDEAPPTSGAGADEIRNNHQRENGEGAQGIPVPPRLCWSPPTR